MPRLTKDEIDRNVLRPKFGDKAITTGHVAGVRICFHEFVVIIPDTEQVFCRTCKEEIDAFHVLRKLARVWDNVTYAQRELEELHRRAEEAKREAANARNRIRGAIKRAPESKAEHYRAELVRRLDAANNQGEWWGMPEFVQGDARPSFTITVNLRTLDDLAEFAKRLGMRLTPKTDSIWFPAEDLDAPSDWEYVEA